QPGGAETPAHVLAQARGAVIRPALHRRDFGQGTGPQSARPDHAIPAGWKLGTAVFLGRRTRVPARKGAGPRPQAADGMVPPGHQELRTRVRSRSLISVDS